MAPQPQGLTLEQKQAIARARAKAAAQKAGVIPAEPASANAPNPIIAAQRASQTQAMSDWAKQQEAEKRHKAELAAMNAASPIPFKDTGPGGAIELNQERPDLLGTRAFGQAVNANIGAVNSGIDMAGKMGVAYGAGLDPSVQGALAGMEYYRGEGDAPERLATAVQQSGAAQQMQQLNERGDVVPRIPIPEAKTAGEVGADIAGTLAGYLLGPGKGINATARGVSREVGAVPGLSRTVRGVGGEAVENAAHAYAFGSSVAPEGADRNMAGLGVATDPLSYIGIEALRTIPRGFKAATDALTPAAIPTNAGGANLGPARTPAAQAAPQPSVAPIPQPTVSNAPRRGAQPAAPGAGQGAGPPTLQATPTTPPVSPALAGSDRKIIGRLLRAGGVPRDDVDRVLTGLVVAHQGSDSARLPLAFFAEEYLPTVLPKQTAEDVIQKFRGFGRERYGANDPKDPSRSIVRGTINELRGSQRETLTNQFEGLLGKETLMTKQGKITRDKQGVAEAVYAEEIGRQQRLLDEGRARPEQVAARDDLLAFMSRKDYFDQIPPEVKLKAADEGKDLWEYVTQNPLEAAHWLQSQLGVLARKGNTIAEAMRMPIVRRIEASVDGYRGARMEYGDLSGQQAALEFGDDLYRVAGSKFSTDQKALEFKKLSRAQKTVAKKSLRDKLLNEFRKAKTGDDQAAVITAMQKDGVLDALETILGAEGKQVADAIRGMVRENERLRAIDLQAGSNTADNLAQMRAAQEAVRSPVNRAVGSIGDESSVARTVFADAVSVALGLPPVWTAGKLGAGAIGKFGAPSRKKLASATRTLYELPRNAGTAAPEAAPRRTPAARGPRRQELAAPTQENLDELLKQYDQTPTPALRNKIIAMRRKMNLPATQNGDEGFAGVGPLSAMVGGAGGYLGAQDINGDGTVDAGERAAFTVGGAAGGYAASRMLPKPKTGGAPMKPPANVTALPKSSTPNSSDLQKALQAYIDKPRTKWDDALEQGKINRAEYDWYSGGGTAEELQKTKANMLETLKTAEGYPADRVWEVYSKDPSAKMALELLAADGNQRAMAIRYEAERMRAIPRQTKRMWAIMGEPQVSVAPLADLAGSIGDDVAIETAKSFARMSEQPFLVARAKAIKTADEAYALLRDAHKLINGKDGRPAWADRLIRDARNNEGKFTPPKAKATPKADVVPFGAPQKAPPASPPVKPSGAPKPPPVRDGAGFGIGGGSSRNQSNLPRKGYEEIQVGAASIGVSRNGDQLTIDRLKVPPAERGKGAASRALDEVLQQADAEGLTVFLTPERIGDTGLSDAQLKAFYGRHGFVSNRGPNRDFSTRATMVRRPQPTQSGFGNKATYASAGGGIAYGELGPLEDLNNDGVKDEKDRAAMRYKYGMGGIMTPLLVRGGVGMAKSVGNKLKGVKAPPVVKPRGSAQNGFGGAKAEAEQYWAKPENWNRLKDQRLSFLEQVRGAPNEATLLKQRIGQIVRDRPPVRDLEQAYPLNEELRQMRARVREIDASNPPVQAGFGGGNGPKAPPANKLKAPPKPKGEGPGIVSRMVTGGVIGGLAGSAGSADPQTPETMALLQQTQQERAGVLQEIASLENALKIFSTGTNEDIQRQLIREGFDLGTTGPNRDGVDGNIGDATKAAIRGRKQDISNSLTAARDRLTAADGRIKELEDRAAFEEAQPPEWKKGAREVAPWIGSAIGGALGYGFRRGAVRKQIPKAAATIAKADALLTPGPVRKGKSAADRAAFKAQPANINEFWQMGGAGDQVPFEQNAKGDWKSRPKASIMPPTKLYPDKRFLTSDYANIAMGASEAATAQWFVMGAEERVKKAEEAVKNDATVANIKALETAKDDLALAIAARQAGLLYAGWRFAGAFKQPYPSSRPNVPAADTERALLLEALKKK